VLSAKALLDAVPCDVDALHGFDIAASVGVGALGGFSVGLLRFLEGRAPLCVDGGEVLLYRWGFAPRERIVFGAVAAFLHTCVIFKRSMLTRRRDPMRFWGRAFNGVRDFLV